ncbi:MAG TPA: pentapeptide repeat-containing protein, partial [Plasticicumulans sp.]|nr:pentapeptide repeat-containing protein [Plasticicumulans sp.]
MQTHITTFYSFKGGVGRSLLLANVGALLAQKAAPVLLWDLDLEAPGLHHIPALRPKPVPKAGFLEWLQGRGERLGQSPSAAELNRLWKSVKPVPGREGLFILPACGDKADFAGLYQQIAWQGPMVEQPEQGLNLFRSLLAHLAEKGGFAHLLLDARTGVTDLGGLMAAVLPHATVLVGGYGRQNRAGLLQVYRALQPAVDNRLAERGSLPPLARLLVTSPVPDLPERRDECRRSWREDFVLAPEATQFEIPFDGRLLFEERLLAIEEPTSPIGLAYRQIADALAGLRDESQRTQKQASIAADIHDDDPRRTGAERVVRGKRFEERVARLLTLLDYRVEPEQYLDNANKVDLIARRTAGLRQECFLVECKDWEKPVPKAELERFRSWLNGPQAQQMRAEGLYVARSYTRDALSYAKSQGLIAVTPQELEAQLFDFRPYLDRLRRRFEESPLARHYVAQRVLLESEPELKDGVDLIEHAQAWANGAGRRLWLVLGDYGTGKSSFFKRFAYELATRAIQEPDAPVPLAIDLKDYPNAISLEALLQEHLRKELNWHGNPEILLYLLAAGRVTLLLDAFDEMGTAALARSVEDQFRQLVRPTAQGGEGARCNRVLITCRTHFFRDQQQIKDVAGGHADDLVSSDSALGQLARQFDASIDEVMLFNDAQIAEFLCRHLGEEKSQEALAFIRRTYDLESLAPRPVLLDMIVQTLPALMQAGGAVTPAGLYLRYTGQWLNDNSGGNLRTSPQQRLKLLEMLAQTLWGLPEHRIHYRKLEALVHELPDALRDGIDPQRIDLELRTAAFLTRTADGFYGFSHKSFREFFFARALLRALRCDVATAAAVLDTARVTPEMVAFLADLMETADEQPLAVLTTSILSAPYRRRVSENAVLLASEWMRYRRPFDVDHPEVWFNGMRALIPEAANLQGADFRDARLSLLGLPKADLTGARLGGAELMHADLAGACLRKVQMPNVNLSSACLLKADFSDAEGLHADLTHVMAEDACFCGASLPFCDSSHGVFIRADFSGSDLTAAVFVEADCSQAIFKDTNCHATRFAFAILHEVDWRGADLGMTTGPAAVAENSLPFVEPVQPWASYVAGCGSEIFSSAAFSSDGLMVLTGGGDGSARLWDAASGIELRCFKGNDDSVRSVAFAPSGGQVLICG